MSVKWWQITIIERTSHNAVHCIAMPVIPGRGMLVNWKLVKVWFFESPSGLRVEVMWGPLQMDGFLWLFLMLASNFHRGIIITYTVNSIVFINFCRRNIYIRFGFLFVFSQLMSTKTTPFKSLYQRIWPWARLWALNLLFILLKTVPERWCE